MSLRTISEIIDGLTRDLTKVHPLPKSSVRSHLQRFAAVVYKNGYAAGYQTALYRKVKIHKTRNLCPSCKNVQEQVIAIEGGKRYRAKKN